MWRHRWLGWFNVLDKDLQTINTHISHNISIGPVHVAASFHTWRAANRQAAHHFSRCNQMNWRQNWAFVVGFINSITMSTAVGDCSTWGLNLVTGRLKDVVYLSKLAQSERLQERWQQLVCIWLPIRTLFVFGYIVTSPLLNRMQVK